MKILLPLLAVLLIAGCCVPIVSPRSFPVGYTCLACGERNYQVAFYAAGQPFMLNGKLVQCWRPSLKTRCLNCGHELLHKSGEGAGNDTGHNSCEP